eukprot:maker-scaffold_6-snap-gene-14.49-mRNA-1 protein AED:0.00 eAED:0.00 QI:90/1/1/1/1/1/2/66/680
MENITQEQEKQDDEILIPDDLEQAEIVPKVPFYYKADDTYEKYKNIHSNEIFLQASKTPTVADLVDTCTKERISKYVTFEQEMWVEYLSNDMKWKVGRVNRVLKQAKDSWDFDKQGVNIPDNQLVISYNVGVEGVVSEDYIRAPRIGLQKIFGHRPWLWQQFCLLQLEKRLRFDASHEYDFEELDVVQFATKRYDLWLQAEENIDFKKRYDSVPAVTQKLLRSHLLAPFDLMDFVLQKEDEWNFSDRSFSVYTYLAVLGSGAVMSSLTLFIQTAVPLALLYNNMLTTDGDPSKRFFVEGNGSRIFPIDGVLWDLLPRTDFDQFCYNEDNAERGRVEGKIILVCVILIYLQSVIPDALLNFFRTSGGAETTYSKINSLRQIVWEQNDDDILQQIGFKLDRMMNTGYIAILFSIMLFVLLNTEFVIDIILNALAIDFIHQIDETIANAAWFDNKKRWLKSGTIGLIIQSVLRLKVLESPKKVCKVFDIDFNEYKKVLNGPKKLYSKKQAKIDENEVYFLTEKEQRYENVARDADEKHDHFVVNEYRKQVVYFGVFERVAFRLGLKNTSIFHRHLYYRTWSRWLKILFLPRVPSTSLEELKKDESIAVVPLGMTDTREFVSHVLSVLSGFEMFRSIEIAWKHNHILQIPLKLLLGILEIIFYLLQISFPFFVLFCLVFIPFCY